MGAPFRVEKISDDHWGTRYVLTADEYGTLEVAPGAGFQLLSHQVTPPGSGGPPLDVIVPPPAGADASGGFKSGNPILFPFPNRVRNASYAFNGSTYRLPANGQGGNHIHGLVYARPWEVSAAGTDADSAYISGKVEGTAAEPLHAAGYPFPVRLTLTYRLTARELVVEVEVVNTGDGDLPFGFGIHPYFSLPLHVDSDRQQCRVQVPARAVWQLDDELIPTGETVPADGQLNLTQIRMLGEAHYDHVFGQLITETEPRRGEAGWSRCLLEDPAASARLVVAADSSYRAWVVYAPPAVDTICFEPYTCVTDAVNLQPQGVDAGLMVLEPGERWTGEVLIYVEGQGQ